VFDVLVDGRVALKQIDLAKAGGGPRTAIMRDFTAMGRGWLNVRPQPSRGKAIVSAIEVGPVRR
jgi:hypothetical protein